MIRLGKVIGISTLFIMLAGILAPSLPVLAINGHGSHYGPEFGGGEFVSYNDGLKINGETIDISKHIQTIKTQTLYVDDISTMTFKIYRNGDPKAVQHVIVFLNLKGSAPQSYQSDTYIEYDKNAGVSVTDPHKIFKTVTAKTSYMNGFMYLTFTIVSQNPMDTTDMIVRAWDIKGSVNEIHILDAIKVAYLPYGFS